MRNPERFFGPYVGLDEAGSNEVWHHTVPLPNGRRIKSNRIPNPDAQSIMWKAFQIKSLTSKTVLDIGAADGYFSLASKAAGADNVTAVDLNYWDWPSHIMSLSQAWGAEISIVSGDFQTVEFGRKFDVILFLGVLYHLENVFDAVRKLRCLLNIDGLIILETQMSQFHSGCPAFEYASDSYPTVARQGRETINSVGVSNYLFPNHEAILNLADTYGLNCERLLDNDYVRTYPSRGLYRLSLKLEA
jgi:hypothetical protein